MTRLALWGMITVNTIATLDAAYRLTDNVPEAIGKPLDDILFDIGAVTSRAPTLTVRAEQARNAEEERHALEELNRRICEFNQEHKSELDYLTKIYGQEFVDNFYVTSLEPEIADAIEKPDSVRDLVVTGFETVGLADAEMDSIIEHTFPKGWAKNEIDSVIFKSNPDSAEIALPEQYNMSGEKSAAVAHLKDQRITTVDFFPTAGDAREIVAIFGHESGHANDWRSDNTLTAGDRLKLLADVTYQYCQGTNIFHSDYVESINNPDAVENTAIRVEEYWAEICQEYFSNPWGLQQDHPEDFQLVDDWVRKQDPEFDPFVSSDARYDRLAKYEQAQNREKLEAIVQMLPDEGRNKLNGIIAQWAREEQKHLFIEGGFGINQTDLSADMYKLFFDYSIELSAEQLNQITAYISYQIDQQYDSHRQEWDNEMISGALERLSVEARAELDQYREGYLERIQVAIVKEDFELMAFESATLPDVQSICEKYHILEDPRIFIRWFISGQQ
ncbi:MAG: hypothetical protein WC544_01025 [Patescibacteria group bacterium]